MKEWKHKCELKLLMCQPNPLRPDRVTLGFVLLDTSLHASRVEVRFVQNLRSVQCIYPNADIDAIEGMLSEMGAALKNVADFDKYIQKMSSTNLPVDFDLISAGALLTDDIEKEIDLLHNQYLAPLQPNLFGKSPASNENQTGRAYIHRKMQEAFRAHGLIELLHSDIPAANYTSQGDPLTIDFGYRSNPQLKYRFLHAVSVVTSLDKARIVALSWPSVKEGLIKKQPFGCEMLAVIEDQRFTQSEQAQTAQGWLLDAGIGVQHVSELPLLAQNIRTELNV